MDNYRINRFEMPFATGPFSYEFIAARKTGKWRIHDSKDNAVGSAEDEQSAKVAVASLNR